MVRTLTWLFLSFFFGVFPPFTLFYKATTKLYNENGNGGGYDEFLIIIWSNRQLLQTTHFSHLMMHIAYLTSAMPTTSLYIGGRERAMIRMAIHPSKL